MINIKTYENFFSESEYNNGEYVVIKSNSDKLFFAKILNFNKVLKSYEVDLFGLNKPQLISDDKVLRKMTPEEIQESKIKLNVKKYNL
jgi:hypothetical protein